jgi:hypothetical protein
MRQEENSSIQGKVFQKSFIHEVNVERLLEGLEMIKDALLVFCRALIGQGMYVNFATFRHVL